MTGFSLTYRNLKQWSVIKQWFAYRCRIMITLQSNKVWNCNNEIIMNYGIKLIIKKINEIRNKNNRTNKKYAYIVYIKYMLTVGQ